MKRRVTSFDYVIVGAGSAGCVLAARLSENPGIRVLLLEAGGWDRDPLIHIPLGWPRIWLNRLHDWMYFAESEPGLDGRGIECARGRVVGGSSSINAMAYVRGHRSDYDRWAAAGLPDWSYTHVLPYFRRQESWEGGSDAFRGSHGPLTTQVNRYRDDLIEAHMEAASQAGLARTPDYNGARQEGFSRWQMTIRDGRRCSAAKAYLRPALGRANLTVRVRVPVRRVVVEAGRAVGVEVLEKGRARIVQAEREIILSGGTINSPQLLMLSGIGAADELARHGIAAVLDKPGVGRNLQDQMSAVVTHARADTGPLLHKMRYDRIARELAKTYLFGRGISNDLPAGMMAFLRSDPAEPAPDMQLMFNAAPLHARPHLAPLMTSYEDGFATRVVGLRPESRGRIELASGDPTAAPRILGNFFGSTKDLAVLRTALRIARHVAAQPALRPHLRREIAPGPDCTSDAALDGYISRTALTVHHPVGTCRMGTDRNAVVDGCLRVHGVDRLRVVDASVMPDLIGGNTNAPTIMIAEKAADLILGRPPPAAAHLGQRGELAAA